MRFEWRRTMQPKLNVSSAYLFLNFLKEFGFSWDFTAEHAEWHH